MDGGIVMRSDICLGDKEYKYNRTKVVWCAGKDGVGNNRVGSTYATEKQETWGRNEFMTD